MNFTLTFFRLHAFPKRFKFEMVVTQLLRCFREVERKDGRLHVLQVFCLLLTLDKACTMQTILHSRGKKIFYALFEKQLH